MNAQTILSYTILFQYSNTCRGSLITFLFLKWRHSATSKKETGYVTEIISETQQPCIVGTIFEHLLNTLPAPEVEEIKIWQKACHSHWRSCSTPSHRQGHLQQLAVAQFWHLDAQKEVKMQEDDQYAEQSEAWHSRRKSRGCIIQVMLSVFVSFTHTETETHWMLQTKRKWRSTTANTCMISR